MLPDSPGPLDDAHYKVKPALTPRNSSLGAEFTLKLLAGLRLAGYNKCCPNCVFHWPVLK